MQKGLDNPASKQFERLIKVEGISVSYVPEEKRHKPSSQNHQGSGVRAVAANEKTEVLYL